MAETAWLIDGSAYVFRSYYSMRPIEAPDPSEEERLGVLDALQSAGTLDDVVLGKTGEARNRRLGHVERDALVLLPVKEDLANQHVAGDRNVARAVPRVRRLRSPVHVLYDACPLGPHGVAAERFKEHLGSRSNCGSGILSMVRCPDQAGRLVS